MGSTPTKRTTEAARAGGEGLLVVVSGPSGVGKTTIVRGVLSRIADSALSVSATTRRRTANEVEARDYYFLSDSQFDQWIEEDRFLEHAVYDGAHYGTPREPVEERLAEGRVVILEIDVQGGEQVKRRAAEALCVFLTPPDEGALLERLRSRGRDSAEVIERRFNRAKDEIARARSSGAYDVFITNDHLDRAIEETTRRIEQERRRRAEQHTAKR